MRTPRCYNAPGARCRPLGARSEVGTTRAEFQRSQPLLPAHAPRGAAHPPSPLGTSFGTDGWQMWVPLLALLLGAAEAQHVRTKGDNRLLLEAWGGSMDELMVAAGELQSRKFNKFFDTNNTNDTNTTYG